MTSSKPYLLRGLFEWITDNDLTPHIIVDAHATDARLPPQPAPDGRLVLNISPMATRDLLMDIEAVSFQARFGGVPQEIYLPMGCILAIYARENGQGMMFSGLDPDDTEPPEGPVKSKAPNLRVIK